MATFQMSYDLAGKRKEVFWTPEPGGKDLPASARWVMEQEFPTAGCPTHGMEKCLSDHGITDIRSRDLCNPGAV